MSVEPLEIQNEQESVNYASFKALGLDTADTTDSASGSGRLLDLSTYFLPLAGGTMASGATVGVGSGGTLNIGGSTNLAYIVNTSATDGEFGVLVSDDVYIQCSETGGAKSATFGWNAADLYLRGDDVYLSFNNGTDNALSTDAVNGILVGDAAHKTRVVGTKLDMDTSIDMDDAATIYWTNGASDQASISFDETTDSIQIGGDGLDHAVVAGVDIRGDTTLFNVGLGYDALDAITTGVSNTAVGHNAGTAIQDGSYNVLMGRNAGQAITSGSFNVALGSPALGACTTGSFNFGLGYEALNNLTTGVGNVAIGYASCLSMTAAGSNVAIGSSALKAETTGNQNTAIGDSALFAQSGVTGNTAIGYQSQLATTTGNSNTSIGWKTLLANTTGLGHVAIGYAAMGGAASGAVYNVAIGYLANLYSGGNYNVGIGRAALSNASLTGSNNTAVGDAAGDSITSGASNTVIGANADAGATVSTGVAIGALALVSHDDGVALGANTTTTAANQVEIEDRHIEMTEISDPGNGAANSARIYAKDNGAGKTQLVVVFGSGAVQVLATEP